jgi:glycosyltransferase involved in cell wall biosynthesis
LVKTKDRAKELGLEVVFTGKLSKPEWITLSKDYAIFINTTHFDNTPISVIEAMGLGLAVVSTNVGGIPFLLEHDTNALLVPDNGVEEMVAAVEKLVENPNFYVKLTQTARNKAAGFDWAIIKQKWTEILQ